MNKYIKILLLPALILSLFGCTQDILEDINENVNDPLDVPSNLMITDIISKTAFSITGADLAFYASVYVEHSVGVAGQLYNAEIRTGEPKSSSTYNNEWGYSYETLLNLKTVIDKTSDGGSEQGNYRMLGMAQVLTAYNLAILTDLMGDVPYSEALQPGTIYQPKIDKQEDLYREIFRLLDEALVNLTKPTSFPSINQYDFLYNGNMGRWVKFANGLKARYYTRLALRNGGKWNEVLECIDKSFTSISDQALYEYNGSTTISPFYKFYYDRDYLGSSQSLHNKLISLNDPRDNVYFMPYPDEPELRFAPNGRPEQMQYTYGMSQLTTPTAPTYLMSYHELLFLKAEALTRLNRNEEASSALKEGIKAAFIKVGLTVDEATAYFENEVTPRFTENPLKEIVIQKYLSFYEQEAIEAYNDYRRLKAMNNDYIVLENPANARNQFPLRFSYGSSDVTANLNVAAAYGDGTYVYQEPVWWAGGTR